MTRPLHIAVAARALSHSLGGVRSFTRALIRELINLKSPHRFTLFYAEPGLLGNNPEAREVYLPATNKFLWDHWVLPRRLRQERPDVVWFPHNVISLGVCLTSVVTVLDLLYFRVPEFEGHEYPIGDSLYMRALIPYSVRRARRVCAISNWTAYDIERILGYPRAKVAVVHLAADPAFRPLPEPETLAVRSHYMLERPFFLYVGSISRRKNIRRLIKAFAAVATDLPHDLVLAGKSTSHDQTIKDLIEAHGLEKRVRRFENIPQAHVVGLYNAATAFVYPSLYEGFGIPPLEAFACGCPVISSQASSLAEVVGDAALTFEPHDTDALSSHLRAIALDPMLRQRLVEAGHQRSRQFSYRRAAEKMLSLLEEAAR